MIGTIFSRLDALQRLQSSAETASHPPKFWIPSLSEQIDQLKLRFPSLSEQIHPLKLRFPSPSSRIPPFLLPIRFVRKKDSESYGNCSQATNSLSVAHAQQSDVNFIWYWHHYWLIYAVSVLRCLPLRLQIGPYLYHIEMNKNSWGYQIFKIKPRSIEVRVV